MSTSFPQLLQSLRLARQINQAALATSAGLSFQTVSRLEQGTGSTMRASNATRLLRALHQAAPLSPAELSAFADAAGLTDDQIAEATTPRDDDEAISAGDMAAILTLRRLLGPGLSIVLRGMAEGLEDGISRAVAHAAHPQPPPGAPLIGLTSTIEDEQGGRKITIYDPAHQPQKPKARTQKRKAQ